jgi:multidrug transporter EmrE-like cation transporter
MKLFMAPVAGFDILLYVAYTVTSVCGLVLVKWYLPGAIQAFQDGGLLRREIAVTGLGAALYITSFLVWLVILSRIQLSIAYPIAIGLTLVFSTIAAAILLSEQLNLTRLVGIAVVFVGIVLITRS